MNQQLSLFSVSSDSENVSLLDSGSDAKRQAIQRFPNNNKEATACVNTYSPGRRKTEYYRLSFNWNGKKKHMHIPGGSVKARLATYRAEEIQKMCDRGAKLAELIAAVETYRG